MAEEIEVNGVTLRVTPATELPFPTNLSASVIANRILHKIEEGDHSVYQDIYEMCELCCEDGIRKETFEQLGVAELNKVLGAVYDDPDELEVDEP